LNDYILTAEHIRKKYGENTVLRDASIHVRQGEIYGLVGKNGSGKTTLFRILTGLIQEYGGMVLVGEIGNRKSRISAVISHPSLFLNLSASENMKEQARLLGVRDNGRIKRTLEDVGLEKSAGKPVKSFSYGMIQRLKLGMALLESPDILILDEPVNGLDPDGIADLRALLLHLNHAGGMTILISSHILNELEQVATCFGILQDGEIIKEVSAQDALQNGNTLEELYMRHTRGGK
jgi:ABC-type multidrug transport system ATPase subunit